MRDFVNVGPWDRILRIVVGLAMLAFGWLDLLPGLWGAALELFGWFPLVTGLAGWCPFYVLLGWRTRPPSCRHTGPGGPPGEVR